MTMLHRILWYFGLVFYLHTKIQHRVTVNPRDRTELESEAGTYVYRLMVAVSVWLTLNLVCEDEL